MYDLNCTCRKSACKVSFSPPGRVVAADAHLERRLGSHQLHELRAVAVSGRLRRRDGVPAQDAPRHATPHQGTYGSGYAMAQLGASQLLADPSMTEWELENELSVDVGAHVSACGWGGGCL